MDEEGITGQKMQGQMCKGREKMDGNDVPPSSLYPLPTT